MSPRRDRPRTPRLSDETAHVPASDAPSEAYRAVELYKTFARTLAEQWPARERVLRTQLFTAAAIGQYWRARHPRRDAALRVPPSPDVRLEDHAEELAVALAEGAAELPLDEAAYLLGSTYAAMLPAEHRSRHGIYYTPPVVVRRLLDTVTAAGLDWARCRVLDPACGGGAFLAPVAERMVTAMAGCDRRVVLRNIATRLRGVEIDPFAAWMSHAFLEVVLDRHLGGESAEIGEVITVGDALAGAEEPSAHLVIGNPPYGRVTLPPEARERYRRSLYGHANLYGVFLDLAVRRALPGGLVAYVTPTSLLSGEYYKRLRGLLADDAPPIAVDFVSERFGVFDDVLQETLLAVYRRGGERTAARVSFVEVGISRLATTDAGEVTLPVDGEAPWILPRAPSAAALATRLRALSWRLADWGYGVSTGPLVWNRYKDRLRTRREARAVPLVWAESVGSDGLFSFRAARRNHAPWFVIRPGDEWLLVERPCVLLQRTTAKEQPRRLVCAELPAAFLADHGGAVTVENHLNMIVPIVDQPAVDTATLAAFLRTAIADRSFRCLSGSVAVSAYELESMPLPAPSAMAAIARLVRRGARAEAIEAACERLYDLDAATVDAE